MIDFQPIKTFGETNSFHAYAIDGWCCVVCYGGTAFAKRFKNWADFDNLIKPMIKTNEAGVMRHCEINSWFYYDYYSDEIVGRSGISIEKLSKSIGQKAISL